MRLKQRMVNPTGIKGGLLSTKISVGTKSVCPLFSSSSCVHKGSGYRPRKTELNGQMSEVGRSKIYREAQKLVYASSCRNPMDKYMDTHRPCSQRALFGGLMGPEPFKQQA